MGKDAGKFLEYTTVVDTQALNSGQASLTVVTNENGGIKDDCVLTKVNDSHYYAVFNGANKLKVKYHLQNVLHETRTKFRDMSIVHSSTELRSLIALQGPNAHRVLSSVLDDSPNLTNLGFMESTQDLEYKHDDTIVTRCGYTGEDGFEVSISNRLAPAFMEEVLAVQDENGQALAFAAGLGARDSLRLEAGLCLYGHELLESITPVSAMLTWTISKRRKEEFGFIGDQVVKKELADGVSVKRCGFIGDKVPIREGTELFTSVNGKAGELVGHVTSGTVGPSVGKAVGMAYVNTPHNKFNTELVAKVRNKEYPVTVRKMPFVAANYYKKP